MKSDKNIFIAFILNLSFSVFELIGGILTGSVAILSDAIHDLGDAASIGVSYLLERKSRKQPDDTYTYGYLRYSVLGSIITTLILLLGSIMVIYNAVTRILDPVAIHYDGMIILALVGVVTNFCAAWFTREGDSLNQKSVNLHMLEDVLGWAVVLVGAVVMRFVDIPILDPILSIAVALYILFHALMNLKEIGILFLEKVPHGLSVDQVKTALCAIKGVEDVHHIHIRSLDGHNHDATMHIVTDADPHAIKDTIRHTLQELGIGHATLELEHSSEHCHHRACTTVYHSHTHHHHHHH